MPGLSSTSRQSGGKITGLLALTMETLVALNKDDWVHVSGDYQVALANGTKPLLGRVSVKNIKVTQTSMSRTVGVADTPGVVTVEARGLSVETVTSGAAITAGAQVGIGAAGTLVPVAAGVAHLGIALMAATAAGQSIDVLVTASAMVG